MRFAENLRELRMRCGFSQAELAENLNLSTSTISMYEKGNREPDFETLEMIADFFNVSLDELLGKHPQLDVTDEFKDELFEQRKLLFDMSAKATKTQLSQIIRLVDTIIESDEFAVKKEPRVNRKTSLQQYAEQHSEPSSTKKRNDYER